MKHTLMRLVFVELEACISVMAVVVGVIIVVGLIETGTIAMPLEWLRSTLFIDEILPALLLVMFAVADYLWRASFHGHHAHIRHVSHA
jgi:hypothetical protein